MTGATHKAGGMLCTIIGFSILQKNGYLIQNVNEGVQWLLMYPFCMWGSTVSDLDHNWELCPSRSYPDWFINHALHLTKPIEKSLEQNKNNPVYKLSRFLNAHHRSWQTHSDITIYFMLLMMYLVKKSTLITNANRSLLMLILMGITLGIVTHFILDMLTPEGVWFSPFVILNRIFRKISLNVNLPEKIHFVPHRRFFATGGDWEMFIQRVLKILTVIAVLWFLLNIFSPSILNFIPFEFI